MIFDLENITVKQLYRSSDFEGYVRLQSFMKSKPKFLNRKAKNLQQLEFGQVSGMKRTMMKPSYDGMAEMFKTVFGVKKNKYENANVIDYLYALNHIKDEMAKLVEKEKKLLKTEPDRTMDMAGAERLNIFKELNTLIKLGKDFGKSPQEIERWTYATVFSLILHTKISGEVMKRYHQLKREQRN